MMANSSGRYFGVVRIVAEMVVGRSGIDSNGQPLGRNVAAAFAPPDYILTFRARSLPRIQAGFSSNRQSA
jgi:hypothetical protein